MKKNLDNFDDLVKNKLDGLDFSFDESNWEKASQMIEAARPSKKPFANILLISSVIITGMLIIGSIYYFSSQSDNSSIKNIAQNSATTESNNSNISSENETPSSTNASEEKNQISISNNNAKEEGNQPDQLNANIAVSKNSNSSDVSNKTNHLTSAKEEETEVTHNENSNSDNYTELTKINNNNNSALSVNQKAETAITVTGTEENAGYKTKSSGKETNVEKPSSSKNSSVYTPLEKFNPENETTEIAVTAANQPLEEEKELTQNPEEKLSQTITLQPDTASSEVVHNDYVKLKRHSMSIEAGAVNSFGWMANNERNGNSVSPIAGINYTYRFTSKSSILVGLQYNSISNLTQSNVSFSVTSFDFGANSDINTYKIIGLQYLTAPIKYIHRLNKNNSIGFGLNMTYLMNIKNKIENYKTIESNLQTISTKNDNGYGFDLMSRYNAQFALSYTRKISKNIGFNVELNQSLKNIFKDYSYFGVSNKNSKPTTLKLSFTYTLFNK